MNIESLIARIRQSFTRLIFLINQHPFVQKLTPSQMKAGAVVFICLLFLLVFVVAKQNNQKQSSLVVNTSPPIAYPSPLDSVVYRNPRPFVDVDPENENAEYITYLWEQGVMRGDDEGKLHPDQPMTRAQWAELLVRVAGAEPDPSTYQNCFSDVKQQTFAPAVCYADQQGWLSGNSSDISTNFFENFFVQATFAQAVDSSFAPEQNIRESEAIGSLSRSLGWSSEDVKAGSATDKQALEFAQRAGIHSGNGGEAVTRENAAGMVVRSVSTVALGQEKHDPKLDKAVMAGNLDRWVENLERAELQADQQEFTRLRDAYIDKFSGSVGKKAATEIVEGSRTTDEALSKVRVKKYELLVESEKNAGAEAPPFDALLPLQNLFASKSAFFSGQRLTADDVLMHKTSPTNDYARQKTTDPKFLPRESAEITVFLDENYRVVSRNDWGKVKIQHYITTSINSFYGEGWTEDPNGVAMVTTTLGNFETGVLSYSGSSVSNLSEDASSLTIGELSNAVKKAFTDLESKAGQTIKPAPFEREPSGYVPLESESGTNSEGSSFENDFHFRGTEISPEDARSIMGSFYCESWIDIPPYGLYCFSEGEAELELLNWGNNLELYAETHTTPTYPYIGAPKPGKETEYDQETYDQSSSDTNNPDESDCASGRLVIDPTTDGPTCADEAEYNWSKPIEEQTNPPASEIEYKSPDGGWVQSR